MAGTSRRIFQTRILFIAAFQAGKRTVLLRQMVECWGNIIKLFAGLVIAQSAPVNFRGRL
jgi:hypothetical protein